jgi:RNA-binding protein PNO1
MLFTFKLRAFIHCCCVHIRSFRVIAAMSSFFKLVFKSWGVRKVGKMMVLISILWRATKFLPPQTLTKLLRLPPTMPAPTALLQKPEEVQEPEAVVMGVTEEDGDIILDPTVSSTAIEAQQPAQETISTSMQIDTEGAPLFPPAADTPQILRVETRKVPVPPHRFTPLKAAWPKLYPPLVNHLKLQVRMNVKTRSVELRTSKHTVDSGALQKGDDFVKAFTLGFDLDDAIALLRLDDLYIETFEVKDVKTLNGDHLSRAIGRIAGKDGKTKFAIENASKTRIVLADSKM